MARKVLDPYGDLLTEHGDDVAVPPRSRGGNPRPDTIGAVTNTGTLDRTALAAAIACYAELLRTHRDHLNRLNVYPVPDADTGTNLSLTLRSAAAAVADATSMEEVCAGIRRGALRGAGGVSGVIMSQLLGAFAGRLAPLDAVAPTDLAAALAEASAAADGAVLHPVEGTILTVAREAAAAAVARAGTGATLEEVLDAARTAAGEALATTPRLLPALRQAGVVDAGGSGFVLFLDALLHVVAGRPLPKPPTTAPGPAPPGASATTPRYEVVVRLEAPDGTIAAFRRAWDELGDAATVVVEDEGVWLAHLHTDHPDAAVDAARAAGILRDVQVTDLVAQTGN